LSIRGGLRADYQTAGGALLSPRLSSSAVLHGFILRAGSGMFVQNWSNNTFLQVIETDGKHLQRFVVANASLSDIEAGSVILEPQIISKIAPNLIPPREWLTKFSVERPIDNFVSGVEYTWTDGTHLLGSQRLPSPSGWTDWLESNRGLRERQLHCRAQYKFGRQSFVAHYEWTHAQDDTDGPFSFPAEQNDIRAEWAPATGIPGRNFALAANLQIGKVTSLNVMESWHGPAPFNITSGIDAEGNGLFTDRGVLPRNSGRSPSFNSMDRAL